MTDLPQDGAPDHPAWDGLASQPVLHCAESLLRIRRKQSSAARRPLRLCGRFGALAVGFFLVVAALAFARLALAPLKLDLLDSYIRHGLAERLGAGYSVSLRGATVELAGFSPQVTVQRFAIRAGSGQPVIEAPRASVDLDPLALVFGRLRPTEIDVYDVELNLIRLADGSAAVSVSGAKPIPLGRLFGGGAPAGRSPLAEIGAALAGAAASASDANSPLAALQSVGVRRGRLVFQDEANARKLVFDNFTLAFDKKSAGAALTISAKGPNGTWTLGARESQQPGGARRLDLSAANLSSEEIALAAGRRDLGFDLDSPISCETRLELDADGRVAQGSGRVEIGPGFFRAHDPDFEPVDLRSASADFAWSGDLSRLDLPRLDFDDADGTRVTLRGSVKSPSKQDPRWTASFENVRPAVLGSYRPQSKPIVIDKTNLDLAYDPQAKRIDLTRLALSGRQLDFLLHGTLAPGSKQTVLALDGRLTRTRLLTVLRAWPSFVAAPARSWLVDHVQDGMVDAGSLRLRLNQDDLDNLKRHLAPAAADSQIQFSISRGAVMVFPGLPSLTGVGLSGSIAGHAVHVALFRGAFPAAGQEVRLQDGSFDIPDTDPKPSPAAVQAHLTGSLAAVADLIGRPTLKPYGGGVPIDTKLLSGQVDAQLRIDTKLGKFVKPSDTVVAANAKVADFTIDKIIGKQRIEQADLSVSVDASGLHANGQGRLLGAPATIALERPPGPDSTTQAVIAATLDDAARAKLGFSAPGMSGPVDARFTSQLGHGASASAKVDLDLTHTTIDGLVPGYVKPAGRPAKASFTLSAGTGGVDIDQFAYDSASSSARGAFRLDSSGSLRSIRLTRARLSAGDDMTVEAEQGREGMRVALSGAVFDARPFLHALSTGDVGGGSGKTFDLTVRAGLATGANGQAISNLLLHVVQRKGVLRDFNLTGRFGRKTLKGEMIRGAPGGLPQVSIISGDAGRLLAFADLYGHMQGGSLTVAMAVGPKTVAGRLGIRNFAIVDDPGLRRILVETPRPKNGHSNIDAGEARFSRLQVDFSQSPGQLVLRDGAMYGAAVGATLEGWMNFARNRVDLSGTFVPAYGVNNLFSQIPVFGIFLGGGAHEGLFGVNFRISGPASGPVLSINPLSAIAPGLLRKIFGVFDTAGPPPSASSFGGTGSP